MAGFDIDESKFRSAMPVPTSSRGEDLQWSGAVFGILIGFIALVAFVGWLLLRALT